MGNNNKLAEVFQDQRATIEMVSRFVQLSLAEPKRDLMGYDEFLLAVMKGNLEVIFEHSESPIERTLLCSLVCSSLASGTQLKVITPSGDANSCLEMYRANIRTANDWWDMYEAVPEDLRVISFDRLLKQAMADEKREPWEGEFIATEVLLGRQLGFHGAVHVMPQARFPDIKVEGKSVRADLFVFIPNNPKAKLIVECDGFQYHGNQEQFIRDRKRDRAFAENGIEVRRYSGSEINNDPADTATNLLAFVTKRWPRKKVVTKKQHPELVTALAERMLEIMGMDQAVNAL